MEKVGRKRGVKLLKKDPPGTGRGSDAPFRVAPPTKKSPCRFFSSLKCKADSCAPGQ